MSRFTWDPEKRDATLRDRGFDFAFASLVFDGPTLVTEDTRQDYGERHFVAIGVADGLHLTVVFTDRAPPDGELERPIISAHPSSRRERRIYGEHLTDA